MQDFEQKVGFDSVRNEVSELCGSRLGREYVASMKFTPRYEDAVHDLRCVDEMRQVITGGIPYPAPSGHDVVPSLAEIKARNSFMSAESLNKLRQMLANFTEIRNFLYGETGKEENDLQFPELKTELAALGEYPVLVNVIGNAVNKFGEIKDTASPELYEIRQQIKRSAGSMQRQMRAVLDRAIRQGLVDKDVTPSLRDGRLVIPVNAGSKRDIVGIVHDESATGKTVFIEPAEVVEAGNRIRELEIDEHREEMRILIEIADTLRPHIDEIGESCRLVGKFDFIIAKAKYAVSIDGTLPNISRNPEIEWYHAVHPGLLMSLRAVGKEVVAMDIHLDREHRILIVSGPNAGGKSVTLKTVAIVQYMMQCGLLPPLYSNSHMGMFRRIMIDIGDEQSIENELSTYSSHLRNMRHFLVNADSHTLFLADEMGSGTEPQIGGAMAQAILAALGRSGAYGVVTTHYQNLKTFADNTEGFVNGAMLYDRQHLQPLFKLEIGNPGSSFALDIAYKMGLPREVIEDAKEIVGSDYINIDRYLSDIARDRRYWNNKRLSIREKEARLDNVLEKYEAQSGDIKAQRREIIAEAKREAREIVDGLNRKIERTILEIRQAQAEKEKTKQLRAELKEYADEATGMDIDDAKVDQKIRPVKQRKEKKKRVPEDQHRASEPKLQEKAPLAIGDYVTMEGNAMTGRIIGMDGKKAEVAFGALRTIVAVDKLKRGRKPGRNSVQGNGGVVISAESRERQLNFKTEIDVRGMRADEALQAVTYFLDDAIQFNAGKVRILHGTGHGILKTLIRQQLKSNTAVTGFEDEDIRFGGAGITVVTLG